MAYNYKFGDPNDPYSLENVYARQRMSSDRYNTALMEDQKRQELEKASSAPMSTGMKGASIGMGTGNPWAALAGGIIGTVAGVAKDVDTRMKHGQGGGKALVGSFGDSLNPMHLADGGNEEAAARMTTGFANAKRTPADMNMESMSNDGMATSPEQPAPLMSDTLPTDAELNGGLSPEYYDTSGMSSLSDPGTLTYPPKRTRY